jgi:hypothetical protein
MRELVQYAVIEFAVDAVIALAVFAVFGVHALHLVSMAI